MKVLLTGANGLLGHKLVELLLKDNTIELIVTARDKNQLLIKEGYIYHPLDITSEDKVMETITKFKPDTVINTAAMTNVDECELKKEACWNTNVNSVAHIIKACEKNKSFLLHLSTDFIFSGIKSLLTESEDPHPTNYYGEGKLAAEKLISKSTLKWAVARTILVYGVTSPMKNINIVLWIKDSLEKGKDIKIVDDQWRTPTLAEDLAMGCYLIIKKQAEGVYHISGKNMLTPYQMATKVKKYFNLTKGSITKVNASTFKQIAKRPQKTGLLIDKAKNELGYTPRSFDQGIEIIARQLLKKKKSIH